MPGPNRHLDATNYQALRSEALQQAEAVLYRARVQAAHANAAVGAAESALAEVERIYPDPVAPDAEIPADPTPAADSGA
jgi:hypothetical protein